jgi:hypothetical protein
MAATLDHHFEFGAVVIFDDDLAQVTVNWAGYLAPAVWRGRANDETAATFYRRVVNEAAKHGPALHAMTRARYEAICKAIEDGDDG